MKKGMIAAGTSTLAIVAIGLTGLMSSTADASGFEKSIVWGGRSSGVAGIATPYIQGADALYFNPAGLAGDKEGQTLSFNISPTQSTFKGPINNANDTSESAAKLLTPFGLIYGNTLNDKVGFGIGAFVSGGANANFQDVTFGNSSYKAEVKTDLQILEVSAGAGYKVDENLKLGLAWRVVMAQADFSFVRRAAAVSPFTTLNAKLTGLKDTQSVAFRAGAQYKVDEATELGLTFRSEVNFAATGKVGVTAFSPLGGGPTVLSNDVDATAKTTLPMAVTLGAIHKLSDEWNLLGEYSWTQYSRIGEIVVESAAFSTTGNRTALLTDWRDQHNLRVGAEYLAMAWPIRYGYGFTSTVTNSDYARASFTPPGPAHTLTLGTGKDFAIGEQGEQALRFDAGFEYTMVSADSSNGAAAGTQTAGSDTRAGTYSVSAYAAHLGLTYAF
ncbi:MAG: outer membrane protein transport protein [Deltaproteobacteria bacterium]|nr:outer membrane protein transport protein [Deltaproteobacteria bacterium]